LGHGTQDIFPWIDPHPKDDTCLYAVLFPQVPNDEETVQNIKIISEFENMARTRQAGNPSVSLLFDGTPSNDTVSGYQCFQWIKKKWELHTFTVQQVEKQGQFIQLSDIPVHGQIFTDPKLATGKVLASPIL
jgi:hypothetical protein